MSQTQHSAEITIINAETVRQYARGGLNAEDRAMVEEILLDDDRARELVESGAPTDNIEPLFGLALEYARSAMESCGKSVAYYEMLAQLGEPATVKEYAQSRFGSRWAMLDDIRAAIPPNKRGLVEFVHVQPSGANRSPTALIAAANEEDNRLLTQLSAAFRVVAPPLWKARIAKHITQIERDKTKVAWLTSAFAQVPV